MQDLSPGIYQLNHDFPSSYYGTNNVRLIISEDGTPYLYGDAIGLMGERGLNGKPTKVPPPQPVLLENGTGGLVPPPPNWRELVGTRLGDIPEDLQLP